MKIIAIGGMDGVGKTTLTNQLASHSLPLSVEVAPENKLINKTIDYFYNKKIDFCFYQTIFLYENIERYQKFIKENKNDYFLLSDRTFLEDIIFAEALLNQQDFEIYKKLYQYHFQRIFEKYPTPFLYLFLESSFEVCEQRTNQKKVNEGIELKQSFFSSNQKFYEKLYSLYVTKDSFFWQTLDKLNIDYKIIKTDNYTTKQTYDEARKILKLPELI